MRPVYRGGHDQRGGGVTPYGYVYGSDSGNYKLTVVERAEDKKKP